MYKGYPETRIENILQIPELYSRIRYPLLLPSFLSHLGHGLAAGAAGADGNIRTAAVARKNWMDVIWRP